MLLKAPGGKSFVNEIWKLIGDSSPRGIAAAIARHITSGELAPGDRLPTVRELGATLGVSPATVSHAWQALSQAGLIESRGRAGSFVRQHPRAWLPPRMLGLAAGAELAPDAAHLDLSRGTPDPLLLPTLGPALSRVSVHASPRPGMSRWRKRVYIAMSHNAADPTRYFHLPVDRTVVVGAQLFF